MHWKKEEEERKKKHVKSYLSLIVSRVRYY